MTLQTLISEVENLIEVRKSKGNFGHAGVPGHRGGSAPKGGGSASKVTLTPTEKRASENYTKKIIEKHPNFEIHQEKVIESLQKKLGRDMTKDEIGLTNLALTGLITINEWGDRMGEKWPKNIPSESGMGI